MAKPIRPYVDIYLRQHLLDAKIRMQDNAPCSALMTRLSEAFWAANDGLEVHIKNNIDGFPVLKHQQVLNGWCNKIRKAVCAYYDALYKELEIADVFLSANAAFISCEDVIKNGDCILKAMVRAKVIAKERRKRLFGFQWFSKAS